jgi:autotransporter-associated beta strand protein
MKALKLSFCLLTTLLAPHFASALIVAPFTADNDTLHLYHLDEMNLPMLDTGSSSNLYNIISLTTGGIAATNGSVTNSAASYTGFSNALGYTNNPDQAKTATNSQSAWQGANGAFTYEAIIYVTTPLSSQTSQTILARDHTSGGPNDRSFIFRLNNTDGIDFINTGAATVQTLSMPLPTSGSNAFAINTWYHIAVTYTGVPNTPNNFAFYLTALNSSVTSANLLGTVQLNANVGEIIGSGTSQGNPLVIGNRDNQTGVNNNFRGLIDEVRISDIARATNDMLFDSPFITFVTQPASQEVATNQTASFNVAANGPGVLSYQWYSIAAGSTNVIAGATNTTLKITTGSVIGSTNYFVVVTNNFASPAVTSSVVTLTIAIPRNLKWAGTGANWDTNTPDWVTNGLSTLYTEVDAVTFDSLGSAQPNVNLTANHTPTVMTVSVDGYSLGGAGAIAGSGTLLKSGGGKLTLTTSNTFFGGTTINGGNTIELDGSGLLGTGTIVNNGSIIANVPTASFPAPISGTGGISLISGSATLSGSNSYTGSTAVSAGTLFVSGNLGLGQSSAVTVSSGAQLYIAAAVNAGTSPLTLSGTGGDGSGALHKNGGNAGSYGGAITLVADSTINIDGSGTLNLTNASGIDGHTVNANLTLNGDGGSAGTISGPVLLGSGGLTMNAPSWSLLGANNNFSGAVSVAGGLNFMSDTALGNVPGTFNASQITLNSGTLGALTNASLIDGKRGITISTAGGFSVGAGSTFTVSNAITGSAITLTKSSPGTLVLKGDNSATLSGLTLDTDTASSGSSDGNTLVASPDAVSGLTILNIRNGNSGSSTLQLDGSSGGITIAPVTFNLSGRNSLVPAVENIAGSNTLNPAFTLAYGVGGGNYQFASDSGTLTVGPTLNLPTSASAGFRTTVFSGNGNIVVASVIQDTTVLSTFTNSVVKTGNGTLTLQAANTYSGSTVISNGLLLVDGSIAAGIAVTNFGGTLGGIGTISSPVFILPGSALAPGDSVGTLTINSDLNIAGNLKIDVNKSLSPSQSNDVVVISGVLTNSGIGTVSVSNLGPALTTGNTFFLFSKPLTNGAAMSVTGAGVSWNNNLAVDGSISVASTINTSSPVITNSVNSGNLILSWPIDHIGWRLQVQTNALSKGLGTNWADVAGSTTVNIVTNGITTTNGSVFYRMVYP